MYPVSTNYYDKNINENKVKDCNYYDNSY